MNDICKDCNRVRSYTTALDERRTVRYCLYLGCAIDGKEKEKCNGFAMRRKGESW